MEQFFCLQNLQVIEAASPKPFLMLLMLLAPKALQASSCV